MNTKNSAKLLLAFALSGMPFMQAYASSCGDVSPLKDYLGEAYYDLDYAPASDAALDNKTLGKLIDSVGLKSGDGVRHRCFGHYSKKSKTIRFELEDLYRSDTANGLTILKAWESSKRKTASATIELPKASQWELSADNVYTSSQLFRRGVLPPELDRDEDGEEDREQPIFPRQAFNLVANQPDDELNEPDVDITSSYMGELATSIKKRNGKLVLTQTLYINGHKAEWVTWNLENVGS